MSDTKYTMVGMSSSGKTCFLTAMYKQLITGIDGFTLWTPENTRRQFERDIRALRKGTGKDRFPAATPNAENATKNYEFRLLYEMKDIISFDIADYAGGALLDGGAVHDQILHSMEESTAMFICIDGALLCDEDRTTRKDNVYYDCAMSITPLIQDFADSHNGALPPIVFVITKSDLCGEYIQDEDELVQIIRDLFSPAFAEGTVSYICAVSLGDAISDDDYKGRFEPVNVHIPLFIAAFHDYYNRVRRYQEEIEEANEHNSEVRRASQEALANEKECWSIFQDDELIQQCQESIQECNDLIQRNQELMELTEALFNCICQQLGKDEDNFKTFIDGKEDSLFEN